MVDTTRDVELRIRANNLTTAGLKEAISDINRLSSSLEDQARAARESLAAHQAAMKAGTASGKEASDALKAYERNLTSLEKRLQSSKTQLDNFNAALVKQNSAAIRTQASESLRAFNLQHEARVEENRKVLAERVAAAKRLDDFNAENRRKDIAASLVAFNTRADANRKAAEDRIAGEKRVAATLKTFDTEDRNRIRQNAEIERRDIRARGQAMIREQEEADKGFLKRYFERRRETRAKADAEEKARPTAIPGQPRTDAMGRPGRGASANPTGFLGLRPYELTNLGYQVNDVFSGLASGQNVTQILAQQGGQFIQIFGMAALKWLPLVAAAAIPVAIAIGAITTESRTLASNREFTAALTANKFAADQSAGSLTKLRKELYDLGVSWDDAGKVVQATLAANVLPAAQDQFVKLAEAIAKSKNLDIKSVTTDLIEGFSGGVQKFEEMIGKFPALDRVQVARIRRMYEEGRANDAARTALQLLSADYDKIREQSLSKYNKATEELRKTWHALLEQLAEKGAFSFLERTLTFFVQGMTNAITTTEAFAKMLDSIDKRFPWLKYVALGPTALIAGGAGAGPAVNAVAGAIGGTGGPVTALTIPSGSNQENTRKFLQEKGYSAAAIAGIMGNIKIESNFDPAAKNEAFRNTGGVGGHFGLAQWDAARRAPLAGSTNIIEQLTLLDNELNKLDPDFKKAAQSAEQAALRFEKAFERSDGQKNAERVAAARGFYASIDPVGGTAPGTGGVVGPNAAKTLQMQQELRAQEEAFEIRKASTRLAQEEKIIGQARLQAAEKLTGEDAQALALREQYVLNKLEEHREQTRSADLERESARAKLRESDKNPADTARAEAAGRRGVDEALRNNITNFEQLEAARDKYASEERTRISKERGDREALQDFKKQLSTDERALNLKHASDLEQALAAVNIKYQQRLEVLNKLKDHSKDLSETDIKSETDRIERLKKLEEGEARVAAAKKGADEALSARGDAIRTINRLEELGEITLGDKERMTKEIFDDSRASILAQADALEQSIGLVKRSDTEIAKLTNQVKLLRAETKHVDPFWKGLKDTFTSSFSSAATSAFDSISEAIGGAIAKTKEWKDVWTSVKNAALNFFATILKELATYILKAQLAKVASSLFGDIGGDSGGSGLGFLGKLFGGGASSATGGLDFLDEAVLGTAVFKKGGVAGRVPATRASDPSWWNAAPRYRTGTVVGLAPDEQRAILHMGEEVLSADNPRNVLNGGGRGGAVNIRNVLVDDRRRIAEAMQGAHGERVIVQAVIRNGATIRELARG